MTEAIIPVILCGGSGTRLWPASRERHPKQFLPLVDKRSLLQNTMMRALHISGANANDLVTVTHTSLAHQVRAQLQDVSLSATQHILREPLSRNTAAAVAYAAVYVSRVFGKDAVMWVLPSDHHVGEEEVLKTAFQDALTVVRKDFLATFGIRPSRPETGYGYIRQGNSLSNTVFQAESFVEKPDAVTAAGYVAAGTYLWNSGMFLFKAGTILEEYAVHAPAILRKVIQAMDYAPELTEADHDLYAAAAEMPFDKAIMEKSSRVAVVPCNPAWSDIGSWESLWEIGEKDESDNVISGNAVCHEARGCLVHAQKRLVTCAGVENIVVIDTGDAILVADRSNGDALRGLVKALKRDGFDEVAGSPAIAPNAKPSNVKTVAAA